MPSTVVTLRHLEPLVHLGLLGVPIHPSDDHTEIGASGIPCLWQGGVLKEVSFEVFYSRLVVFTYDCMKAKVFVSNVYVFIFYDFMGA